MIHKAIPYFGLDSNDKHQVLLHVFNFFRQVFVQKQKILKNFPVLCSLKSTTLMVFTTKLMLNCIEAGRFESLEIEASTGLSSGETRADPLLTDMT